MFFALMCSCNSTPETKATKQNNQKKTAAAKTSDKAKKGDFWDFAKGSVPLSAQEVKQVRKVYNKYKKQTKKLKKEGKWEGDANKSNQLSITANRTTDTKKILNNKYPRFKEVRKEWTKKTATPVEE